MSLYYIVKIETGGIEGETVPRYMCCTTTRTAEAYRALTTENSKPISAYHRRSSIDFVYIIFDVHAFVCLFSELSY